MGLSFAAVHHAWQEYHAQCPRTDAERSANLCTLHHNPQVHTPTALLSAIAFDGASLKDLLRGKPETARHPLTTQAVEERLRLALEAEHRAAAAQAAALKLHRDVLKGRETMDLIMELRRLQEERDRRLLRDAAQERAAQGGIRMLDLDVYDERSSTL